VTWIIHIYPILMWPTVRMPSIKRIKEMGNSTSEADTREWDEFIEQREQHRRQREDILEDIYGQPASGKLEAYLQRLERGPDQRDGNGAPIWDRDTFIEGIKRFAELLGSQRSEYYDNPLKGLHYPDTFLNQWTRSYPQLPTPMWLDGFKWQCPPGWCSNTVGPNNALVLFYNGTELFCQALNRLILGPTVMDCGMVGALVPWFGLRYSLGDEFFERVFPFKRMLFILTQKWQLQMSKDFTRGNLLHDFYDSYREENCEPSPGTQTSLQVRTVYNHPLYLDKHPGGGGRLQNIIQIGTECIVFNPLGPSIMSLEELDHSLLEAFNKEQTPADIEEVELLETKADCIVPRHGPRSCGDLAQAARALANHTLTKAEWDESLTKRTEKARNLHFIFNIERLKKCVADAIEVGFEDNMGFDDNTEGAVFRQAKRESENRIFRTILSSPRAQDSVATSKHSPQQAI
jgi:hypothetical protein